MGTIKSIKVNDQSYNLDDSGVKASVENIYDGDLNISDEYGNVLVQFKDGHIKTKNFDSRIGGSGGTTNGVVIKTNRAGKKIYLFGDSITYWDNRTSWYDPDVIMYAFPSYIRDILKMDVVNKGQPGDKASGITNRLKNTNLSDAYAITYMAGANDLNNSVPIETYKSNIEDAVIYMCQTYPNVKMYLLAPIYTSKGDITPYADVMEEVAKEYSIPILRWDYIGGLNSYNADTFYVHEGTDGTIRVHPNNAGHEKLSDCLISFLQNY